MFRASRRGHTAKTLSAVAYLSANMRELLEQRAVTRHAGYLSQIPSAGAKRRFLSLPTHAIFVNWRRTLRKNASPPKHQMYSIRASILRRALRRRRRERAYIDLRLSARQRRLPREKPTSFRKRRRRRNLRRRRAVRRGRYSRRNTRKRQKVFC